MKAMKVGISAVVVLVGSMVVWNLYFRGERLSDPAYKLARLDKGAILAMVSSTGKLNPLNTVKVGSQVSGNIKEIYKDYNDRVEKDQIIALIDPAVYAAQLAQAKAQLLKAQMQLLEQDREIESAAAGIKSAEAQLVSASAAHRDAELRLHRFKRLGDAVARADVDSAQATRDSTEGTVALARAAVLNARAQHNRTIARKKSILALIEENAAAVDLAEIKLRYCTIRSPIDGQVISRDVDIGQTVAATLQSPVLFTIAEDLTRMQVEIDVSEADIGRIREAQTVRFTVDAFPEKEFTASVREVRNVATDIQNVVTYKVIADVDNAQRLLRPGMTANVNIIVAQVKDVLKLPNSALRFKPPGEESALQAAGRPPVRETAIYKKTVSELQLDSQQSEALVGFIESAGQKLKAVYALPETERDLKQAWKGFYSQVLTSLYKILREDQYEKFRAYVADLKKAQRERETRGVRSAKVYLPGPDGRPVRHDITIGITNEDETQIVGGDLKSGDQVIVGLAAGPGGRSKQTRSLFSTLFGRK